MTDIGKRLLGNLPPKINRKGEIVSALIANEKGTGALEQMFLYGDTVKNTYSQADNVYTMDGGLIDQAMDILSHFERFYNETDVSFIKRNKSIFIRSGDVTWGTTWNMKHVFEYYFPKAKIFLIDNIGRWTENLLVNSSFESSDQEEIEKWVMSNCVVSSTAAFGGEKGCLFTENGTLSQSVSVEEGNYYFITCAINGEATITVSGDETKKLYSVGDVISGGSGSGRTVKTEEWNFVQFFFYADKTEEVTISLDGISGTKLDLVTLDKKKTYPCFMIYVWFNDVTIGGDTLHLGTSSEDPIPGINYDKESYFDKSFFSGIVGKSFAEDIYQDILTMVKAAGTKADIMLITQESA